MQRLTLIYLAAYLLSGGCGVLVPPALALRHLLSNGTYGDIMPRAVGLFMFVLGGTPSTPSWRVVLSWSCFGRPDGTRGHEQQ